MSKDRKKLLHIHSSVNDKQPTPATLELGELGVNNAKGNAFISTKNSDGEVVRFSEDETIVGWIEQKEVFPYEAYVRGADESQVGEVTEQDLLNNKSNLIIKLNQVVPENTDYSPYDEKVNGAKDIYGNLINPISSGNYKDGAGLAINMSKYAMQGANPSFSSVTTTCHATFNGTTEIKGKNDSCGSNFIVDVSDIMAKSPESLISGSTLDVKECEHIFNDTNNFKIKECTDGAGVVNVETTTTHIKSCGEIKLESKNITLTDGDCGSGQTTVEVNDLCLVGENKINVYGNTTNVGLDCNDVGIAPNTNVYGGDINITANNNICETAQNYATLFGAEKTQVGVSCDGNVYTQELAIGGQGVCVDAADRATVFGKNKSDLGINCDATDISNETKVSGRTIHIGGEYVDTFAENVGSGAYKGENEGYNTVRSNGQVHLRAGNIIPSADYGSGVNVVYSYDGNSNEVASNDITRTAYSNISDHANSGATFYGGKSTTIGASSSFTHSFDAELSEDTIIAGTEVFIYASGNHGDNNGIVLKTETDSGATYNVSDIILSSGKDFLAYAKNNICEVAYNEAHFYGENRTIIGEDCNGDKTTRTSIYANENGVITLNSGKISEASVVTSVEASYRIDNHATSSATYYADDSTEIGFSDFHGDTSNTTSIKGKESVSVDSTNGNLGLTAKEDILESAENDIIITADNDICESAGNDAKFFGVNSTVIGKNCQNEISNNIVYYRNVDLSRCGIKAETVDEALEEVYDRSRISLTSTAHTSTNSRYTDYTLHQDAGTCDASVNFTVNDTIVSMSASTYPASSETLTTYDLWQYVGNQRIDIGKINIPKDHLIKDVGVYYGTVEDDPITGGQKFYDCSATTLPESACSWYIGMEWHVWDESHTDKWTYVEANSLVQDIGENNSNADRGVNVKVWYNSNSGRNEVSADTKINFTTPSDTNAFTYSKHDGEHWESGTTIVFKSGSTSGFTQAKYKPWSGSTSINIPTCVGHLNRHQITFQSGATSAFTTSQTYDPGKDCANTAETINIPTEIGHLNRGKLIIKHNDENGETFDPASEKTITLQHNALAINYGVTCDSSDAVNKRYDTSSEQAIVIPKTISDITNGTIVITGCTGSDCITINGNICMSSSTLVAQSVYSTSDINAKENIKTIDVADYSKTDKLEFKSFNFKNDETKTKTYGVIAQDVQGVGLNEIVHKNDNGELSVDYTSLLILKIASLEDKIKALSDEIKELKANKSK